MGSYFHVIRYGLYLVTSALLCHVRLTKACTCIGRSNQNSFCDADYAVRAYVVRQDIRRRQLAIPGDETAITINDRIYTIQVVNVLKANNVTINSVDQISSPESLAACGVDLQVGRWYFISGKLLNGEKSIIRCNWIQDWVTMTSCQINALFFGLYRNNCDCKVATCDGAICYPYRPADDNGCVIKANEASDRCLNVHAICIQGNRGRCSWARCPSSATCF